MRPHSNLLFTCFVMICIAANYLRISCESVDTFAFWTLVAANGLILGTGINIRRRGL